MDWICSPQPARPGAYAAAATGCLLVAALMAADVPRACAQFGLPQRVELSAAVRVDELEALARTKLELAKAYVAQQQWDEAIDTYQDVMESQGGKLIRLDEVRYIPVREYCHWQLASLAPEGLALYRSRVDPLARRWLDEGRAARDAARLRRVVDQFFASSWADEALFALGEIALEQGDYQQARWCWERISPALRAADGSPLWLPRRDAAMSASTEPAVLPTPDPALSRWIAYPDTDLSLADVLARLVLVSILEGSLQRAAFEREALVEHFPQAVGRLAGRDAPLADTLAALIEQAAGWPQAEPPAAAHGWPTFAGAMQRTRVLREALAIGRDEVPWRATLGDPLAVDVASSRPFGMPELRVADSNLALLSYHPLIVDDLVLINTARQVFAFRLASSTAKPHPAWPAAGRPPGEIYFDPAAVREARRDSPFRDKALGAPRFTMTAHGGRLYARMGSPVTSQPRDPRTLAREGNYLICLDLRAEGRLAWKLQPENDRWAFEGSPVADQEQVYVALRYSDQAGNPQQYVACYDARSGAPRWRTLVASAQSPARGDVAEITSNLLTLAGDTLFLNTNLGAVAAVAASSGELRWVHTYPRAQSTAQAAYFSRDLSPCVYYQGVVCVAPADSIMVLGLDAATGKLLWESTPTDIVHLLGVAHDNLIVSGRRLLWIDVFNGRLLTQWPEGGDRAGFGRGLLAGDQVLFPTHDQIFVLDQQVARNASGGGRKPRLHGQLFWPHDPRGSPSRRGPEVGNLVGSGQALAIATATELIVYSARREPAARSRPKASDDPSESAAYVHSNP